MISFVITAICTFFIILAAGTVQKKSRESSFIVPDDASTNNVKLKHARQSPDRPGTPRRVTPFSLNYGSDSGKHEESGSATNGVIFVDSSSQRIESEGGDQEDETKPLLMGGAQQAEAPAPDIQFSTISEDTGISYRNIAGKHLIRFVVLLLLLIFSSLVVSVVFGVFLRVGEPK